MKVVFICTGNTCRSPMAEHVFRRMLDQSGKKDVTVQSAGVAARPGQPAAPAARRVLEDHGIESIRRHASRPVGELNLSPGDRIYTMTPGHREQVEAIVPEGVTVEVLKEAVGETGGISDPFGQDVDAYRSLYAELEPLLDRLLEFLDQEEAQ